MKKLLLAALALSAALPALSAADARPGDHHGNWRNHGPHHGGGRERFIVGRHYNGRGYWDGRSWYQHRERHRGGWRYR